MLALGCQMRWNVPKPHNKVQIVMISKEPQEVNEQFCSSVICTTASRAKIGQSFNENNIVLFVRFFDTNAIIIKFSMYVHASQPLTKSI